MQRDLPSILVLAAGASTRMGGEDKLMRQIDGLPLLRHTVRAACNASEMVVVTLPPGSPRRACLDGMSAKPVEVSGSGMSASIRAGVAACPPGAVLIHLADMPEIDADDLRALLASWRSGTTPILRAAAADGRPGQPVVFDAALRPALLGLSGDVGARAVVAAHEIKLLRLDGVRALVDLDTPEAWAAWEATRHVR